MQREVFPMRFFSYLNTAKVLLQEYDGSVPFSHFLKQYFSFEKKHGSKDRKQITHFCYSYFRLGHTLLDILVEERIKIALFLCSENLENYQTIFDPSWTAYFSCSLSEKISFIQTLFPSFDTKDIFPFSDELSNGIEKDIFSLSHLIQPDLFIRIRGENKKNVVSTLQQHSIAFSEENESCLRLNNTTSINAILDIDKEVVIQDLSSQSIAAFLEKAADYLPKSQTAAKVWDCCAASGGKSILAKDILQNIQLTVSDTRRSIVTNLQKRFAYADIARYQLFVADLTNPPQFIPLSPFDIVICDVPCSGSGTWGRTPEQLYFFNPECIQRFTNLQKAIALNTAKHVKKGSCFLYITCSVFKKENEEVVDHILKRTPLLLIEQSIIKGYDKKADSMFAALFTRP